MVVPKVSQQAKPPNWDIDGPNGPDDPVNSQSVLLDWWTTGNNYDVFRGGRANVTGATKKQQCEWISRKIVDSGIATYRSPISILNKIAHMELKFRSAHAWATTETGAGLLESDLATWKFNIQKKFLYYEELLPVMINRASTQATLTNEELDDDDDTLDGTETTINNSSGGYSHNKKTADKDDPTDDEYSLEIEKIYQNELSTIYENEAKAFNNDDKDKNNELVDDDDVFDDDVEQKMATTNLMDRYGTPVVATAKATSRRPLSLSDNGRSKKKESFSFGDWVEVTQSKGNNDLMEKKGSTKR